jgi:hypothetical protein
MTDNEAAAIAVLQNILYEAGITGRVHYLRRIGFVRRDRPGTILLGRTFEEALAEVKRLAGGRDGHK